MLSTQLAQEDCGPRVVVVGNYKGGSGKSTFAMHLIVALLKAGRRVASFDLDVQQQTLSRYIENRRQWARQNGLSLELPKHTPITDVDREHAGREIDHVRLFTRYLATLQGEYDFIVIDTPGNESHLSLVAHAMADTLITPINDSFVDLDVIVTIDASGEGPPKPSRYVGTVEQALEGRRSIGRAPFDWVVIRNRLSPVVSRHERQISEVLAYMAPRLGFRALRGLTERLVFRELFPFGLTAFDQV